jgi:hypothetical protein
MNLDHNQHSENVAREIHANLDYITRCEFARVLSHRNQKASKVGINLQLIHLLNFIVHSICFTVLEDLVSSFRQPSFINEGENRSWARL